MKIRVAVGAIALLLLAGAGLSSAVAAASVGDERPVALPPFIVEEATKGRPWRYAEAMGYEVLSRCSDSATRRVVESHYALHQLLSEILPPSLQVTTTVPRTMLLYDAELQPAASQEVIARMLRSTPLPGLEESAASFGGRGSFRVAAPAGQRYSFLPNMRLWDRDAMAVFMIVRRDDFDESRLALTQDYVAFVVQNRLPTLPPWFVHGFLALYRKMNYAGDRITLEALEWISEDFTAALKKDPKTAPGIWPLAEFFYPFIPPRQPEMAVEPVKLWQAQSMLFVRWGLDSGGPARRTAFLKFVQRSAVEGGTEELFRACLGVSYADAETQISAYLPAAVRRSVTFRPAKMAKLPAMAIRDASDGQIARIKGDWERLEVPYVRAISPELATKYTEQARRTLKRAYDRGDRDAQLLAVMGLCECDAGDDAAARDYLEAAAASGAIRPRANFELARLRLQNYRAAPEGRDGKLSPTQAAEVLKPLFAARALQPPLPEVYELIADVWTHTASPPTRGHLAVLDEGIRFFPRRSSLVLAAAELYLGQGFKAEAETLLEFGRRLASDEPTRTRLSVLEQQIAAKR